MEYSGLDTVTLHWTEPPHVLPVVSVDVHAVHELGAYVSLAKRNERKTSSFSSPSRRRNASSQNAMVRNKIPMHLLHPRPSTTISRHCIRSNHSKLNSKRCYVTTSLGPLSKSGKRATLPLYSFERLRTFERLPIELPFKLFQLSAWKRFRSTPGLNSACAEKLKL